MKYILSACSIIGIILILVFCHGGQESEYMRIHIQANSNSAEDQNVKYLVKDKIVDYLIPYLSQVQNKDEAKIVLKDLLKSIESVANDVLSEQGFDYKAKAYISFEEFPTRKYDDLTLEEGYYDALMISLGSGEGDNWWCVVYPAICFTDSKNSQNYEYISKIWEIINNVK